MREVAELFKEDTFEPGLSSVRSQGRKVVSDEELKNA